MICQNQLILFRQELAVDWEFKVMSSCRSEPLRTITTSSGNDCVRSHRKTSKPSTPGIFKSSSSKSGKGNFCRSVYWPSPFKYAMTSAHPRRARQGESAPYCESLVRLKDNRPQNRRLRAPGLPMFLPSPYIYYCKLYARFTADANLSWLSAAGPCEQRGDKEEISAAKTSKIRHKNV